jgi:UDP-GlcNAc:undecaprenyl-phosphate GlcNAc-1-phosphate transferase
VALTGLIDDYRPLPAWVKLAGQFIGFLILVRFGIRVRLPLPEPFDYAITLLWLLGITNAINFLDNMDGLSAGIAAVTTSFILLLALTNGTSLRAGAALLGACSGFGYNFRRTFMGDRLAVPGFLLAVLASSCAFPKTPTSSPDGARLPLACPSST